MGGVSYEAVALLALRNQDDGFDRYQLAKVRPCIMRGPQRALSGPRVTGCSVQMLALQRPVRAPSSGNGATHAAEGEDA